MLEVRSADISDKKEVFEWRNDETTRQMVHTPDPIEWEEHCKWFDAMLKNEKKSLLICSTAQKTRKIAAVWFDIDGFNSVISINISPSMRGRGLAKNCLKEAISYFTSIHKKMLVIKAEIKSVNIASRKVFEGAGFVLCKESDGVLFYELIL